MKTQKPKNLTEQDGIRLLDTVKMVENSLREEIQDLQARAMNEDFRTRNQLSELKEQSMLLFYFIIALPICAYLGYQLGLLVGKVVLHFLNKIFNKGQL